MITATRYHDFSAGHRICGHESKCAHLHGHNYRVYFEISSSEGLDSLGRLIDFSVIKIKICQWLEDNWDHKFLMWKNDPLVPLLTAADPDSMVIVDFNPTAKYLIEKVGPEVFLGTYCKLISVTVEETRKCSVRYGR